jgi:hypothetical protein
MAIVIALETETGACVGLGIAVGEKDFQSVKREAGR